MNIKFKLALVLFYILASYHTQSQTQWTADGNAYYHFSKDGIEVIDLLSPDKKEFFLTAADLVPEGKSKALEVQSFQVAPDGQRLLLFANTKRVWRENTKGDYWLYEQATKKLTQVGQGLPESSLMFAKFSPDGKRLAYVSKNNIYIEQLSDNSITQITTDGTDKIINGTFDWVYEEEFGTQDGFRWSPDSKKIAYWKQDARDTRYFYMINNTDSLYSFLIPVEYPKVGLKPSATYLWTYDLASKKQQAAQIDGEADQHYIPRMEWVKDSKSIILQQLNRKQNSSKIILSDVATGLSKTIHQENSDAWIDIKARWNDGDPSGWDWMNNGKEFI